MEKVFAKRSLKDFRDRENPWKNRSPLERLQAMAVICQTHGQNGSAQSGFPRVYKITRK
ncbi:hypothetical protein OVA24_02015 [Luteolibacter sp. SL250]|uniref:hypothetical protein n=1 Tax=Luteolibacter sp. SL250 TaxID=2995170 RepID=UPI00226FD3E4|nr:hypothetical protein [Luteolibacter sp. SL250]WAC20153.1 hypothetical protein OVA24_02015 [Luteolibacter sp. SL250]